MWIKAERRETKTTSLAVIQFADEGAWTVVVVVLMDVEIVNEEDDWAEAV
jgi:hypothetical protein